MDRVLKRSKFLMVVWFTTMAMLGSTIARAETMTLHICGMPSSTPIEGYIFADLLRLALDKVGADYTLKQTATFITQPRRVLFMLAGNEPCTVTWMGSSEEYERDLLPVYVPLFRGMLGYRVSYIRKSDEALFENVKSVEDLARLRALAGSDWVDVKIMRAAGLQVVTGSYESLPRMLANARGDYYPRGIFEIFVYAKEFSHEALTTESKLLLHYPLPMYFFVGPKNARLRDMLLEGLTKAIADGSYDQLIANHRQTRDLFRQLKPTERRILEIDNPTLTEASRLALEKFHIDPTEFARRLEAARRLDGALPQ